MGEKWRKMGEIWGRNGRETAVAEWRWAQVLRLLRLLRVLKLVKQLPQLQMIVGGLLNGLTSIGYISLLLALVFYLYGVLGIILFRENDPWHFSTLDIAMLSLFRCATMEDWTDVMYTNMYGCDLYGYDLWETMADDLCTQPQVNTAACNRTLSLIFVFTPGVAGAGGGWGGVLPVVHRALLAGHAVALHRRRHDVHVREC